ALKRLTSYRWPGNVRQLENVLLNAWILSDGPELEAGDFELPDDPGPAPSSRDSEVRPRPTSLGAAKQEERERIVEALKRTGWNRAEAAQPIGMPRRTLYRRLKKYGIQ